MSPSAELPLHYESGWNFDSIISVPSLVGARKSILRFLNYPYELQRPGPNDKSQGEPEKRKKGKDKKSRRSESSHAHRTLYFLQFV